MPKKNRTTLRDYFRGGKMPREDHFQDLIDSSLNLIEEGFDRSPDAGLKVTTLGLNDELMSYYRYDDRDTELWTLKFGENEAPNSDTAQSDDTSALQDFDERVETLEWISNLSKHEAASRAEGSDAGQAPIPTLSMQPNRRVGVGRGSPRSTLDVGGFLRSEGRMGGVSEHYPADGEWHPITTELQGCHAFEITAGAGGLAGEGQYALLHAIAMKSFHRNGWLTRWWDQKRGITVTNGSYVSRLRDHNRLELRWYPAEADPNKYCLWIRSNCAYTSESLITVHMSRLWNDELMLGSRVKVAVDK